MRRWTCATEAETRAVGAALAAEVAPDGVLLLSGRLGAGKTVLVKGVAQALGVDPSEVQSPTFTLMREHRGAAGRMVHLDLYRLDPEQVAAVGVEEQLAGSGVKVVEWAERLPFAVDAALCLSIRRLAGGEVREIVEMPAAAARRAKEERAE